MASPAFPEPPPAIPATSFADCDAAVAKLVENKDRWVQVSVARRIALLEACLETIRESASAWVAAACKAKGIQMDHASAGEEWLGGPMTTARNLRLFAEALKQGGQPKPPKTTTRPDGQQVATVFPVSLQDMALFTGFVGEVWIEPGKPASQGAIYRAKEKGEFPDGKVSLVLGAGNVASIGPMDALYKLFVDDEVVICKSNPVNAYLGPHWEAALKPLVDEGVFVVVHGGAAVGAHLCHHDGVDTIHMTGSDKTHDIILWGTSPDERARRKEADEPLLKKPISSELGCVTPVLIVPGEWSDKELDFVARHVAAMVTNNASFNCNAAKVLVVANGWAQKEAFLLKVRESLAMSPSRKAYYPGAQSRYQGFVDQYPNAMVLSDGGEEIVPWTVLPDVPAKSGEYALTQEAFCGVLAEVALDVDSAEDFMKEATRFANDDCWGTLSCSVMIDPRTEKAHKAAFEDMVAGLRFGGVGVNLWPGVIYGLVSTTWGAFPGHSLKDIRSGRGVVHNSFFFDHPQKSVLRAPFTIAPKPVWFSDHKNQAEVGKRMLAYEVSPSWLKVPGIALAALKG
jgi:acyl-CoA reductase-like NAD-dependent aldehyde dehydrogenase